jgi:hypothetical protein
MKEETRLEKDVLHVKVSFLKELFKINEKDLLKNVTGREILKLVNNVIEEKVYNKRY